MDIKKALAAIGLTGILVSCGPTQYRLKDTYWRRDGKETTVEYKKDLKKQCKITYRISDDEQNIIELTNEGPKHIPVTKSRLEYVFSGKRRVTSRVIRKIEVWSKWDSVNGWYKHTSTPDHKYTDDTRKEILERGEWEIDNVDKGYVYENKPAKGISIALHKKESTKFIFEPDKYSDKFPTTLLTNEDGNVKIKVTKTPKNWAFTEEKLISKIKDYDMIKDINSSTRLELLQLIREKIKEKIKDKNYEFIMNTLEERIGRNETIVNGTKTLRLHGKEIKMESIYSIIKLFIDDKINSKIETAELTARDIDSHARISDARLEMKIEAPEKKDLADDYFTGKLLEWAIDQIKDYGRGKLELRTNRDGILKLNVYVPSKFGIEATHKKYHYLKGSDSFSLESLDKYLNMIELGKKIRIAPNQRKEGSITDKK